MIKAKKGKVTLKGSGAELAADLTITIRAVKETLMKNTDKEFAMQIVSDAFRFGMMTEEELHAEVLEKLANIIDDIKNNKGEEE